MNAQFNTLAHTFVDELDLLCSTERSQHLYRYQALNLVSFYRPGYFILFTDDSMVVLIDEKRFIVIDHVGNDLLVQLSESPDMSKTFEEVLHQVSQPANTH